MASVTSNSPESTITTARTESGPAAKARPSSPRTDAWRRYFRVERRRMRDAFTRERLISMLKTMAWVIPLTLLIWIYAEREQIATLEGLSIRVDVATTDATQVVTLVDQRDGVIRADVRGPRSSLERLRRQMTASHGDGIRLEIEPGLSTGRIHELRTTSLLNNHPEFWNFGLTVRNADPSNLQVYVDELDEREIPVRAHPDVENLAGPPTFDPPTVTVRGPRLLLDQAASEGKLEVYANLATLGILTTPGEHNLPSVRLTRPTTLQEPNVRIEPEIVRAVVNVRARDFEELIRSMPVYPMTPPGLLNDYRLELQDESIANITVLGPPEQIEELREYRPVAVLELQPGDVQQQHLGQWRTRRVRIDLPSGVRLAEEREIRFRLVDRSAVE